VRHGPKTGGREPRHKCLFNITTIIDARGGVLKSVSRELDSDREQRGRRAFTDERVARRKHANRPSRTVRNRYVRNMLEANVQRESPNSGNEHRHYYSSDRLSRGRVRNPTADNRQTTTLLRIFKCSVGFTLY